MHWGGTEHSAFLILTLPAPPTFLPFVLTDSHALELEVWWPVLCLENCDWQSAVELREGVACCDLQAVT